MSYYNLFITCLIDVILYCATSTIGKQMNLNKSEGNYRQKDELFQILSSHRRQQVIKICDQAQEPVALSQLAQRIAATEQGKEIDELTGKERKRIYTSLQQTHLPMMARADVIEYDGRTAELTEDGAELSVYMDIVPPGTISWAAYYFGLSVICGIVITGVHLGIYPQQIPEITWAVLITLLVSTSSIVHLYTTGQLPTSYFPFQLK